MRQQAPKINNMLLGRENPQTERSLNLPVIRQEGPPHIGGIFEGLEEDMAEKIYNRSSEAGINPYFLGAIGRHESMNWTMDKEMGGGYGRGRFQIDMKHNPFAQGYTEEELMDDDINLDIAIKTVLENMAREKRRGATGADLYRNVARGYNAGPNHSSPKLNEKSNAYADIVFGILDKYGKNKFD